MPIDTLCAGYVLRLTQRLSRLTFELRDLRTGNAHRFASAAELACFLDDAATHQPSGPRLQSDAGASSPSPQEGRFGT